MNKVMKILGDSFSFIKKIADNMMTTTNSNYVITEENIKELINSFNNSNRPIFVYPKHKGRADEERFAIGEIKNVYPDSNSIGLLADIEFFNEAYPYIENKSFSPSVELLVDDFDYSNNKEIKLKGLQLTGLAFVEIPASKNVELLASALVELNKIEEHKMTEDMISIENLLNDYQGDLTPELFEKIKSSEELLKALLKVALDNYSKVEEVKVDETPATDTPEEVKEEVISEETKVEDETPATDITEEVKVEEDEKKEEDVSLSIYKWDRYCRKHFQSKGKEVALSSIDNTYEEANSLYKAKVSLSRIVTLLNSENKFSFINGVKTVDSNVNLSKANEDTLFANIGKSLR